MKITIVLKAAALSIICFGLLLQCTERTGGSGSKKPETDTAVMNVSLMQIERWVDYVNYQVSRHALLNDNLRLEKFDAATAANKSYDTVIAILTKLRSKKDNVSQNEVLASEINKLKTVVAAYKPPFELLAAYLSDSIFKDTINYKNINLFYQTRIKNAESAALLKLQGDLRNAIQDSIKNLPRKNNEPSSASPKPSPADSTGAEKSSSVPTILISAALLIIAAAVYSWIKKRKKVKVKTDINSDKDDNNVAADEKKVQPIVDSHKTENEKLWRKVKEQEILIAKLEEELLLLKNKPSQDKIIPSFNTANAMYFPAPNNSSFPIAANSNTKRSFDAYQLEVNGSSALFNLLCNDAEVVKRALDSPDIYLLQVCEIEGSSANFGKATNIKLLEKGQLQKEGDQWVLKKKSLIKLL
jgi:hypothetical protein